MDPLTNAVAEYRHLRDQGKTPREAVEHVRLRYGVSEKVLMERVNGKVADPERVRRILAEARDHLRNGDGNRSRAILADLYRAITGEDV